MKTIQSLMLMLFFGIAQNTYAFCGFYVAKADAKLFNKASQVIISKSGDRFVVTMSNDFSGEVKDFAMVVPVPVVPEEDDIKTVNRLVFDKLDAYSGPRLVEYNDPNPCYRYKYIESTIAMADVAAVSKEEVRESLNEKKDGVTIVAKYTVGEYDILILDAEQSAGLERWLLKNGYHLPAGAKEVLEPYIKSNMKFFVAKVNMEQYTNSGFTLLNPLQISYNSKKFMLPIRLGMANAEDYQDLIVYVISPTGRAEVTNYRTVEMPTNKDVPEFIESRFGKFYLDVFNKSWKREGKNVAFLEYGWDISASNAVKCDPCPSPPPVMNELAEAGAFWLTQGNGWGSSYTGNAYFTRFHIRYDRENFPQDLFFQETPNRASYQARYVINHPAEGDLSCTGGLMYLQELLQRREKELHNMSALAGWSPDKYPNYVAKYANRLSDYQEERIRKNGIDWKGMYRQMSAAESAGKYIYFLLFGFITLWLAVPQRK